jgi:hypothetical protein
MGRERGADADAIARAVNTHRSNLEAYGRENHPDTYWDATGKLDRDSQEALDSVRTNAQQRLLQERLDPAQQQEFTTALEAAAVAAKMLDWQLAASFCQSAAQHAANTPARAALLERVLQFQHAAGDCIATSATAREIAALTPGNESNTFRADYLALLAGESLEVIAANCLVRGPQQDTARANLIRAFSAYRLGMPLEQQNLLTVLPEAQNWPPGPRAVLAALLARSGETAKAFQLAERIQSATILPEERKLLQLAR